MNCSPLRSRRRPLLEEALQLALDGVLLDVTRDVVPGPAHAHAHRLGADEWISENVCVCVV